MRAITHLFQTKSFQTKKSKQGHGGVEDLSIFEDWEEVDKIWPDF